MIIVDIFGSMVEPALWKIWTVYAITASIPDSVVNTMIPMRIPVGISNSFPKASEMVVAFPLVSPTLVRSCIQK